MECVSVIYGRSNSVSDDSMNTSLCDATAKYSTLTSFCDSDTSDSDDSDDVNDDGNNTTNSGARQSLLLLSMTSNYWIDLVVGRIISFEQVYVCHLGVFRILQ